MFQDRDVLVRVLSSERVRGYEKRLGTSDPETILSFVRWNTALSQSLYSSLQVLEVGLRNSIHSAASRLFGRADWLDDANVLRHPHEFSALEKARRDIAQRGGPESPGRLIAELSFGFWTSLLDKRYEQTLWPSLLKEAFPGMPRRVRTRANLSRRFNVVRRLRNRVFHHEAIWHWTDLADQHAHMMEAVGWISDDALGLATSMDQFNLIHARRPENPQASRIS